jgi:pentose-5-phosphate-3-epimerase
MQPPTICPTITATNESEYKKQIDQIKSFADRIHIDLMDGKFTGTVSPPVSECWWPEYIRADIHLMFKTPMTELAALKKLRPNMVIIHAESEVDHEYFCDELHKEGIKTGLALLQDTDVDEIQSLIEYYDQFLVFSGNLGQHGGTADLNLITKAKSLKLLKPNAEIAWDGGINDDNISQLVENGVNVLNVGGFIQDSPDPFASYAKLKVAI